MSFPKTDRNFRSRTEKKFPPGGDGDGHQFARVIAAALAEEWGCSPSSRKLVGRLTFANERAVRNWFDGYNGPNGEHLVELKRHSDAELKAMLDLSGRRQVSAAGRVLGLRDQLREVVDLIDDLSEPSEPSS